MSGKQAPNRSSAGVFSSHEWFEARAASGRYRMLGKLPDKLRCQAIAKGTGERCRCPRVRGGKLCDKHGGYREAGLNASAKMIEARQRKREARAMLKAAGREEILSDPAFKASGSRYQMAIALLAHDPYECRMKLEERRVELRKRGLDV